MSAVSEQVLAELAFVATRDILTGDERLLADEREALRLCRTGPRPPWLLNIGHHAPRDESRVTR